MKKQNQMGVILMWLLSIFAAGQLPPAAQTVAQATRNGDGETAEFDEAKFNRTFTHKLAEVNGVRIHYAAGGTGETAVVLLHGNLKTWYAWRKAALPLAEKYAVVIPDLRGVGGSSRPLAGYDTKTVAEDIFQLMTSLGYQRFFVVGHDVGGWVAYALAANHRDAVRRLVIVDVPLPGIGLEETMDVSKGGSWHFGFGMLNDLNETLVAGKERTYLGWFAKNNTFVPNAITEADLDEYARAYSQPGAMRASFSYYRALAEDARQNRESARTKLRMPVLAVGAAKGQGERGLKDLQTVAENARGVMIEDCGHYVPEERPAELVRALLDFFAEEAR